MPGDKVRFGPFTLDTKAGELVKGGRRLRLQGKPLSLLLALIERPHEVMSRDELRARLWPPTMVVEFDDGLNSAVNKLRNALGDSADAPKYIETVGRRGYRFIGHLADPEAPAPREEPANPTAPAVPEPWFRRRWSVVAALAVGCALLSAGALVWTTLDRRDPSPVTRFAVVIPSAQRIEAGAYQSVAISPTASHLAYVASGRIYLRARDAAEARPVAGTEDQGPLLGTLFSPDGQWIAYYSSRYRELRRVPLAGGTAMPVASAQGYLGGSWGADGRIAIAQADGIFTVSDAGGEPELLIAMARERGERAQNPALLPNGRGVLFTYVAPDDDGTKQIVVHSLEPGGRRVLIGSGTDGRYVDSGHVVYADAGTLMAVPFDVDSLQVTGAPLAVARGVLHQFVIGSGDFAISRSGTLVYRTSAQPLLTLTWVDRNGEQHPVGAPSRAYIYARVSPDGSKIAASLADEESEIFVWDIAARTFTRLTFNPEVDILPIWTPDSKRIVFGSTGHGRRNISRKRADGTGATELLLDNGAEIALPNSLGQDGAQLVYRQVSFIGSTGAQDSSLWVLPLDGSGAAEPLLATEHHELNGEVSPDGRWLAYQSNETGTFEIYIRPFANVDGGRWQVSTGGGIQPLWSPDGSELFYLASRRLMSAPIGGGAIPSVGASRVVLDTLPYTPYERSGRTYDISPDGRRFLIVNITASVSDNPFDGAERYEVVLNWAEELKRLSRAR